MTRSFDLRNLKLLGLLLGTLATLPVVRADKYFETLREDRYVPVHCRDFGVKNFREVREWFVYGIDGYQKRGFDYEYPVSRTEATWLWEAFKKNKEPTEWPRNLDREVELIKTHKEPMGFEFGSEGEVLELLALVDLEERFSRRDYFMTGGLVYRSRPEAPTTGELDLLVGDMKTCNIVAVGEAKLGSSGLSKAKEQIARFKGFLRSRMGQRLEIFSQLNY